ncbi:MAG: ComEC/Rec2 family competence protein [Bacteroidales bacterium]|nr:ComEC/Rec2 family competence protein [Candidatus Physcousia equi]
MSRYLLLSLLAGALLGLEFPSATLLLVTMFIVSLCLVLIVQKSRFFVFALVASSLLGGASYANLRQQLHQTDVKHRIYKPTPYVLDAEAAIDSTPVSREHSAEIKAVLLGDRSQLTAEQKQLFRRSGAQHMLALSGMHLSILLVLLYFLFFRNTIVRWRRWLQFGLLMAAIWFYVYLTGSPNSLVRAALMSSFFALNRNLFRESDAVDVLSSSVFLMFLFDPLSLYDIGTQMSVAAMLGIVLFYGVLRKKTKSHNRAIQYAIFSFSAWFFTMPLVAFHFGSLQLWQPLVGIVLVPVISLSVYLSVLLLFCALFGQWWMSDVLASCTDVSWSLSDTLLRVSSQLPMSQVAVRNISPLHLLVVYLILLSLLHMVKAESRAQLLHLLPIPALMLFLLFLI